MRPSPPIKENPDTGRDWMWHLQKFLYRNVFGFWFLLHIAMLRRKFSWRRLLLANLVDRRNLASRCASLVSTNWKALWMLSCCSPSNQYYLYLWAFLDSCDVWALTGSSAKPFLVDEIELPRDSIFRTLWEPPHDIPSLESKREENETPSKVGGRKNPENVLTKTQRAHSY